jgi:hypothetical protein
LFFHLCFFFAKFFFFLFEAWAAHGRFHGRPKPT